MTADQIKYIVIHCTAGFASAEAVQDYFTRPKSKGGRGWRTGGYHRIIEVDGTVKVMYPFTRPTNGVAGYNDRCIHISYVGGVERNNVHQAKDSRTAAQKTAIEQCIMEALIWLEENGNDLTKILVLGHRDFSPDKDGSGVIESWERIKECPSYDALEEYHFYNTMAGKSQVIPSNRK